MKRRVVAAVDDLFFAAKIRATAAQLDLSIEFPRTADALISAARAAQPSLFIFDLHSQRFDPIALVMQLKADPVLKNVPAIGFFSHVDTAIMQQAQAAGYDSVIPRSAFSKNLAGILDIDALE